MNKFVVKTAQGTEVTDPPIARLLFNDTRLSVVWLVVRVLVGWQWLQAGWEKLTSSAWMAGDQLKRYWAGAVAVPAPPARPAITFDWYRSFLQSLLDAQSYVWFAKLVALGEFVVGVALILGLFVGIAAFFGAFMNWNYIMAGTASTNPLLLVAGIFLILAWKTAGYLGLDHFLLARLGTPWGWRQTKREVDSSTGLPHNSAPKTSAS